MCNEAARLRSLGEISAEFNQLKIPLRFPEGLPNLGEAPSIRITDPTVIVRAAADDPGRDQAPAAGWAAEMVTRRWSWPGAGGKPVYNFRSEGRRFGTTRGGAGPDANSATVATGGRCLIPIDAFFEFTDPPAGAPKRARKDKWRFTAADGGLLGVAGLWRVSAVLAGARAGVVPGADGAAARGSEAFTMLTCAPGPDIAPYHSRQIVLLPREHWAAWLAAAPDEATALIAPAPAGTLRVERAG